MSAIAPRARACHSLVLPVSNAEAVRAGLPAVLAPLPTAGLRQAWVRTSGDTGDGPRAARLRETERRRPLAAGAGLRCVLLVHRDGAELVLVADRDLVPWCCLSALAHWAADGAEDAGAAWRDHLATPHPGAGPPRPGGPGPALTAAPCGTALTTPADLVAAIADVCVAAGGQDEIAVAVEEPGAPPTYLLVALGARVEAVPVPPTAPMVGVLLTDAPPERYLPALAPPYPITITGHRGVDGALRVATAVDTEVVDAGLAQVLVDQFVRRWRDAATAPATERGPFLLDEAEVTEIRRAGDGGRLPAQSGAAVHEAFLAVARTQPERVAISDGNTEITYGELDAWSAAAASGLIDNGVAPGDRVGVCMARTARAIVALLAVLRAGACYVPFDTAHPAERRAYVARDADLRLIVADEDPADGLPDGMALSLDELTRSSVPRPLPPGDPDTPAYVIYTSGTTGHPKGVVIPHRNVVALCAATRDGFALSPSDVWAVSHSLAFDFSVWEIWGCLLTGGRLVVVPHWTARSPADFAELLQRQRVTVLNQTPSAFTMRMPAMLAGATSDLRLVIFAGEALRPSALLDWVRRHPLERCRLVNMYGITETTVHVTWHDVTLEDIVTNSQTVGAALPGWAITVRSPHGDVLPFHVAGEICVSGAGLASGYHARPELTAERFRTDSGTGARYYRSGDLGRLRPDGTVDYLGRMDDQVQIRGYRVELGEIRVGLLGIPAVRDAVVAFDEEDSGGTLSAYVVAEQPVSAAELRRRLAARLPDYMVPERLHVVTALPLTANGKVDLAALARLVAPSADEPVEQAAPGGHPVADVRTLVTQLWERHFGAGCTAETFFDLGGNSLQALKISDELNELGFTTVDPRDIYLNPSVEDLVARIESG